MRNGIVKITDFDGVSAEAFRSGVIPYIRNCSETVFLDGPFYPRRFLPSFDWLGTECCALSLGDSRSNTHGVDYWKLCNPDWPRILTRVYFEDGSVKEFHASEKEKIISFFTDYIASGCDSSVVSGDTFRPWEEMDIL
jgi:hypothetical protein